MQGRSRAFDHRVHAGWDVPDLDKGYLREEVTITGAREAGRHHLGGENARHLHHRHTTRTHNVTEYDVDVMKPTVDDSGPSSIVADFDGHRITY